MQYATVFEELGKAVMVTLILPIAVLCLDYFIRAKIDDGPFSLLILNSGPDGCILSIGATGAIFLDPKISAIPGMTSPLLILCLVIFLLFMRVACIKSRNGTSTQKEKQTESVRYGATSLLVVFFVIAFGYLFPLIK